MKPRSTDILITILIVALLALSGCATSTRNAPDTAQQNQRDPLQGINRAVLGFNLAVDRYALKPVAKTYAKIPQPVQNGVSNFFSNLWLPNTILNDVLQGKFAQAGRDTGRFVINTMMGCLGLMDVATSLGLPKRREDFGQTLAVWGVPAGPYLMLPFLGPSNLRDAVGLVPQYQYTDAVSALESPESTYASGLRIVDARTANFGADDVLELQPDKYLFLREGYRQWRTQLIYDGNPPAGIDGSSEDELIDELLDDEE